jgi:nucleoside-diphosphate-sugar epimerase
MKALLIGGSGPTGPHIVEGLRQRGYRVAVLNRGVHKVELPADVEQIVGDPHFAEPLRDAIGARTWDLVIASYGRLAVTAEVFHGKAGRFLGVGGGPAVRGFFEPNNNFPRGHLLPIPEDAAKPGPGDHKFETLVSAAEDATMRYHPTASIFRYFYVYGPRQVMPQEWSIVRRVLDGRRTMVMVHGGLGLFTHAHASNAAHTVLLAVDKPEAASGRIYNVGDEHQLNKRQIVEVAAKTLGVEMDIVSIPNVLSAKLAAPLSTTEHKLIDNSRAKHELGYRDQISALDGFAQTVRWYADHPLERGGEFEQRLHDAFDYEAEDKLIALAKQFEADVGAVEVKPNSEKAAHPYAHPKESKLGRDEKGR